jgi:hypothetical protein
MISRGYKSTPYNIPFASSAAVNVVGWHAEEAIGLVEAA